MPGNRGKLIVIEGLDGSGKTTQTALLLDSMRVSGIKAEQLKFPDYESKSSTLVKMYLDGEIGGIGDVNLYAASAFYAADRYISYERVWKKSYNAGTIFVADRYTTSNIIYQMAKLQDAQWAGYIDWLYDFEYDKMRLPKPDAVVYLDMPPQLSRTLLEKRYGGDREKLDIHEKNLDYLGRCRCAALYAAKKLAWHVIVCGEETGGLWEALPVDKIAGAISGYVANSL
ncbi:MAG: deoxynucleoside kinase [Oscillospiraceae bacterium]|jgi:dTMP kinase|nr:deoxynucleoside kinase [Oscillospiraceae bacterium]